MLNTVENAFIHAPIGMALVDITGRTLRVNDALCRITGFGVREVLPESRRFHPEDQHADGAGA